MLSVSPYITRGATRTVATRQRVGGACRGAHSCIQSGGAALFYEWDPRKARANLQKHGVDFADAITALDDGMGLHQLDPHSIRLISARLANPRERREYEDGP